MYIAGYLREHNVDVRILDCVVEGYDNEIIDEDRKTFGLSENSIRAVYLIPVTVHILPIIPQYVKELSGFASFVSLFSRYEYQTNIVVTS